ncbi:sodium channel protein Nach-like [Phlebotomus argentipes]|uniref:sodium channel protein Nach-like n=1 Tax=Phlebotomus argentipes TaxID=94469 RepID=UPI002892B3F0|nr:sodium channel protein Nach-like [Phlebotomus argentipes]
MFPHEYSSNHKLAKRRNNGGALGTSQLSAPLEHNYISQELGKFLKKSSLHCYHYLMEPERSRLEFWFWILIHTIIVVMCAIIGISSWNKFTSNPLVTSLHDTHYPIEKVPFPAVSICNNNRLSKKASLEYAKELAERDPERRDVDYFFEKVRLLGKLHDYDVDGRSDFLAFHELLEKLSFANDSVSFDIMKIIRKLTPHCSDILLQCLWLGQEQPCMNLFSFRRTQYGFCCTFNYIRKDSSEDPQRMVYYTDSKSWDMGLVVTLNASLDDYYYPMFNLEGFVITVFGNDEYPDPSAGYVSEILISPGYENYLKVDAYSTFAERSVANYEVDTRGCLFDDENKMMMDVAYSRADCVVNCRIKSIIRLCECVPFFLPHAESFRDGTHCRVCDLQDLPCLEKYKIKWATVVNQYEGVLKYDMREVEESLYCPDCLPKCSDTKYKVSTVSLPLQKQFKNSTALLSGIVDVSSISTVKIYFGSAEAWVYRQDVALYWFQIFSFLGGIIGLMSGFSIISIFEGIWFLLGVLFHIVQCKIKALLPSKKSPEPLVLKFHP